MNTQDFKKKVREKVDGEYTVIGAYVNMNTKIMMKHNCTECNNHQWEVKPKKFLYDNTRCPICAVNRKKLEFKNSSLENKVIELYKNKSMKEISKELNVSESFITRILAKNNIEIDDGRRFYIKYSDDEIRKIAEEYLKSDVSVNTLAKKHDIQVTTLYYRFKQLGYDIEHRKYHLNEDYFKKINIQNKAYILGFLMADGCVAKSTPAKRTEDRLIISISKKDKHLLEFIKKELECDYEIIDFIPSGTYSNNEMSRLVINSEKICTDLKKYGIVARKTGKECFPNLRSNLKRHFLRGFLDGDGWITKSNKSSTLTIGFISNKKMLEDIKEYLINSLSLIGVCTIHKDTRDKDIYYLNIHESSDIAKLKKFLYSRAKFYLTRKYNKLT